MKRNIISTFFAVCIASAMIQSCDPLEPSTYTESFHRIASVQYKEGKASLLIDYTGEKYIFSNFQTKADMERFEVEDGDRVIAQMTVSAVGSMTNNKLTLDRIANKYPVYGLAQSRPADSLNYAYRFNYLKLSLTYPQAWSQGHILNIAPEYYSSSRDKKADFLLYPSQVSNDTLIMDLYSDIPDTVTTWSYIQTFLCFDISSLRDSVPDPAEQSHRDSLLNQLAKTGKDSILVKVVAPDYMRKRIFKKSGEVDEIKFVNIPSATVSVSIPFDF